MTERLRLKKNADRRLKAGHLWLYSNEIDTDATPLILKEGMQVDAEGLRALQSLLPSEIWRHREKFFFEGMLMEIGPCHRRYAAPSFYTEATRKNQGDASLDEQGNLENYRAGIPFPQETLSPQDPLVGVKWAWNLEKPPASLSQFTLRASINYHLMKLYHL